ncbi:MAG: class I SAM-dependent methyltransferase [Rubrivivax sp.]
MPNARPNAGPNARPAGPALERSFGDQAVAPDERRARIRRVFEAVAPRYDLMNDLMSFGIHRLWKRTLARRVEGLIADSAAAAGSRMAAAAAGAGARDGAATPVVVDLAGGTGDVARLLVGAGREVIVCDPSPAMMARGARRAGLAGVRWVEGEAERLPFDDASVDLLVVSFGLRNATDPKRALAEIRRVLKPGAGFACLEFSRPAAWFAPAYDLYSRWVIPALGAAVAGAPEAYRYLVESIRRFPDQAEFGRWLREAGFDAVRWENLSFGIACVHLAQRPLAAATSGAASTGGETTGAASTGTNANTTGAKATGVITR